MVARSVESYSRSDQASAAEVDNPFLALLARARPEVDAGLSAIFEEQLATTGPLGPEISTILKATRELSLRGGKRMRAALVLASQQAFARDGVGTSRSAWRRGVEVGVAMELLQTYFLIHDDWMDQDAERRGGPSVHRALANHFSTSHIANCAAILAGDYLVALANERVASAAEAQPQASALIRCFSQLQLSAVLGQQLDIVGQCKDAELIYKLKTSSYSVSGPLELGAILAGVTPGQTRAIAAFGDPIGIAFQLRDDLLGVFADPKTTGKPFASDILAGKWTWLVQFALENGNLEERTAILDCLGKPKSPLKNLKACVSALKTSGAQAATEARIHEQAALARKALKRLKLSSKGEALLNSAAQVLTHRNM